MTIPSLARRLYTALVFLMLFLAAFLLIYGWTRYDWHDFDVFHTAARAALTGQSIYITVGQYNLPFWYFPWTAWFYIPFAIWPYSIGLLLYKAISILCATFTVLKLSKFHSPSLSTLDKAFIFALLVPMSVQLMQVGQMDYILLGLIVFTMFAMERQQYVLAGLLLPFLWIKPHLVILFTLAVFWRGGKRSLLASLGLSAFLLVLETLLDPGWHMEMLNLLQAGSQRTDGLAFTTLPNMLGFQENWVGTANLPFTLVLLGIALLAVWKFRYLPTMPLLSLALAASMFAAPRAYAYDLPLLIPALIWLTANQFRKKTWIWVTAAMLPFLSGFASITYLVSLLVFLLTLWKAHIDTHPAAERVDAAA